jgi:hypothetical protein
MAHIGFTDRQRIYVHSKCNKRTVSCTNRFRYQSNFRPSIAWEAQPRGIGQERTAVRDGIAQRTQPLGGKRRSLNLGPAKFWVSVQPPAVRDNLASQLNRRG